MFGNRLGWALATVVLLLEGGLLYLVWKANQPSPPTAWGQKAATFTLQINPDPRSVASFMVDDSDAAELYRQALEDFHLNQPKYEAFLKNLGKYIKTDKNPSPLPAPTLEGVGLIIKARTARRGAIFGDGYAQLIKYDFRVNPVEDLRVLGNAALFVGNVHRDAGRADEAKQHYEAAFALGVRLFEERMIFRQVDAGSDLMGSAGILLSRLARAGGQNDRAKEIEEFERARKEVFTPLQTRNSIRGAIINLEPVHSGDMIELATRGGDRVWKVEAVLALGRAKFNARTGGDQRGAVRFLKKLAADAEDPVVRFAATVARDLDSVGYNQITVVENR
jgi:tetratricopeptide (TPR) repeat protein